MFHFSGNNSSKLFLLVLLCVLVPSFIFGATSSKNSLKAQGKWLVLGPAVTPFPLFFTEQSPAFGTDELLSSSDLPLYRLHPAEGLQTEWPADSLSTWKVKEGDKLVFSVNSSEKNVPHTVWLATYLKPKRWMKLAMTIKTSHPIAVFLDNKRLDTSGIKDGIKCTLKMEEGKHLFMMKSIYDPSIKKEWSIQANIELGKNIDFSDIDTDLSPRHPLTIHEILDQPVVTNATLSFDGKYAALSYRKRVSSTDQWENWVEIVRLPSGKTIDTIRNGQGLWSFRWSHKTHKYAYLATIKEGTQTIFVGDIDTGRVYPLLEDEKNLLSFEWGNDDSWIVFSKSRRFWKESKNVKHMLELPDRWTYWRSRSFLYLVSVPDGVVKRLTAGELTTSMESISPDGKSLLFTRSIIDYTRRPYSKTELYLLDIKTITAKKVWEGRWWNGCEWSPDGKKLIVLGGPSTFGEIGWNVPNGTIPNEYDSQAYIFNLKTGKAEAVSRNFNPSIDRAFWSKYDHKIYFLASDKTYRKLYRFDPANGVYKELPTRIDVINGCSIADNAPVAIYWGTSVAETETVHYLDLKYNKTTLLRMPDRKNFSLVQMGRVENWSFINRRNTKIMGRIYLPPNFDPSKKYPCIVYYYGGTSPVTRDFGGRYPKNWWAAHGYVVYVLQPSGATGFGQAFSAFHVNDWGRIVAGEIIYGVQKFLKAHPYVDPKRVGCIGASYGGFMTMLLVTRTDMFSAAVAHAGISSISSYWGQGWWGYIYNAVSAANSFPWNRKDIYVNQSPLFHADKIHTPLLLLHGTVDTNVPPGESMQLFTALKLLGRPVEFVQIKGQNHHVITPSRKEVWYRTVIAWFDRYLKSEPQFWDNLYPKKEHTK